MLAAQIGPVDEMHKHPGGVLFKVGPHVRGTWAAALRELGAVFNTISLDAQDKQRPKTIADISGSRVDFISMFFIANCLSSSRVVVA